MLSLVVAAALMGTVEAPAVEIAWRPRRMRRRATPSARVVPQSQHCPICQARRQVGTSTSTIAPAGSDQARCQAEANYMAARGIRGHVWGCIGNFEGCGWTSNPNGTPGTCTPRRRMTLTGDAIARSHHGAFRVRSWR